MRKHPRDTEKQTSILQTPYQFLARNHFTLRKQKGNHLVIRLTLTKLLNRNGILESYPIPEKPIVYRRGNTFGHQDPAKFWYNTAITSARRTFFHQGILKNRHFIIDPFQSYMCRKYISFTVCIIFNRNLEQYYFSHFGTRILSSLFLNAETLLQL